MLERSLRVLSRLKAGYLLSCSLRHLQRPGGINGFRKIALLNSCHGGNSPIIQVLKSGRKKCRSEIAVFIINCGAFFGNQAVKDTVTPGNSSGILHCASELTRST